MKTLRLSLELNEFEMADYLDITVNKYSDFEEAPIKFGGDLIDRYLVLLESIQGVPGLSHMFLEFVKFDLQVSSGAIDIFERFPLTIVENELESAIV